MHRQIAHLSPLFEIRHVTPRQLPTQPNAAFAPTYRIGITGGIGAGKSSVAALLARWGMPCVDLDAISHQLTSRNGAALEPIADLFGAAALHQQQGIYSLNRDYMRELVFDNPNQRLQLQAILYPLIDSQAAKLCAQYAQMGSRWVLFDIPLLYESALWQSRLHHISVVDCSLNERIQRVRIRNPSWSMAQIEAVIATQASDAERISIADSIINNHHNHSNTPHSVINGLHLWTQAAILMQYLQRW
jgi:dephospho-CoA kinase